MCLLDFNDTPGTGGQVVMTPNEAREYCEDLVDQLRCERQRRGIPYREIAKLGGPSEDCTRGIEWGKSCPTLLTAVKYAEALGLKLGLAKKRENE